MDEIMILLKDRTGKKVELAISKTFQVDEFMSLAASLGAVEWTESTKLQAEPNGVILALDQTFQEQGIEDGTVLQCINI